MNTMFRMPNRIRIAALAVGLGAVIALAGCSSDGSDGADDTTSQTAEQTMTETDTTETEADTTETEAEEPAEETEESGDDNTAVGSSEVSITIDGEALEIADPTVVCQEVDGTMTIAVGSASGADGIGATLTTGDSPTVKTVALGSLDGTAMAWAEGAPGEANATVDGSTYTISGSMSAVDMNNPTAMTETPFEMVIACP